MNQEPAAAVPMSDQLQEYITNLVVQGDSPIPEQIAYELLAERFPTLHSSTVRKLAAQAVMAPVSSDFDVQQIRSELGVRISKLMLSQFPHLLPKRHGRGKPIYVGPNSSRGNSFVSRNNGAELNPEGSSDVTDQKLTEYALRNIASPRNEVINREHEQATDRLDHILAALRPKDREVLLGVQPNIEVEASLRETARQADLHAPEVSRAFESARRADKTQIFIRRLAEPLYQQPSERYNPHFVAHNIYMQIHQGAVLPYIGEDRRTSVGRDIALGAPGRNEKSTRDSSERVVSLTHLPISPIESPNPYPPSSGCAHGTRQWLKAGFADLRLTCLSCQVELKRTNPFVAEKRP
jgi:hypothetical protein